MSLFKKLTKLERVNENIDAKQKSVDQLGATENPRKIKVLDTDRAPAHPFDGKLVGEESKKKSLRNPQDNPCWKGYKPVGTKQKDGRTVPNCVPKEGVAEGSGKNVVKSVKVGNFRHDLVDTGFGWQVRIYIGDQLYDSGLSKNSEQKGLAALDDAVAYTKKQLNIKDDGVAEGYTGRETKDGVWRVFKDGKAVAVAGPFKTREEAAAWIKKQKQGVAEGAETAADIDQKIEFHKQGQAAAQYKGAMNKMHAKKIRELLAKKEALKKQGVAEASMGSLMAADKIKKDKEDSTRRAEQGNAEIDARKSEEFKKRQERDAAWWKAQDDAGKAGKDTFDFDGKTYPLRGKGVAEGSVNDYFKRRKDEEDRIAGIKAPAKRTPGQTDYAKRRAQEKKVDQGVAEGSFGSGYGSVFTLYVNTGEKPATKTKTKKFKREDDAVLWAEDYADQHEMFPNLKMEIQDENGNVVWELEESQGVAEASEQYYAIVHKVTKKPLSTHRDLESAKDEWRGLDRDQRPFYAVMATKKKPEDWSISEGDRNEMDTPEFRAALAGLKKKAQQGPTKTVYDPKTGKYKVVPVKSDTPVKESAYDYTIEDVISKLKDRLGDYLTDVAQAVKKDTDLKEPGSKPSDTINAVKTLVTDDGHEIRIHGNEDDGFRITIKNKDSKAKFANLKEAEMAARAYCARRKNQMRVPKNFENEK